MLLRVAHSYFRATFFHTPIFSTAETDLTPSKYYEFYECFREPNLYYKKSVNYGLVNDGSSPTLTTPQSVSILRLHWYLSKS